jgi:hypothetical protein
VNRLVGTVSLCLLASTIAAGCSVRTERAKVSSDCRKWIDEQQAKIDRDAAQVNIYLLDSASATDMNAVAAAVAHLDGVKSVALVSKADALQRAKKLFADDPTVLEGLPGNPFPASVEVKFDERPDIAQVEDAVGELRGVDEVKGTGEKADRALDALRKGAGGRDCRENFEAWNKEQEKR